MRRFTLNAFTALLVLVVAGGVFSYALKRSLSADNTSQALVKSGTYAAVAPSVIQQYGAQQIAGISVSDPIVREAAAQAFSGEYIQTKLEPAINSTFSWLDGRQARPDFVIDYGSAKQQFINQISVNAAQKLNSLPSCTLAEIIRLGSSSLESLSLPDNLTCLPPGASQGQLEQLVRTYLANSPNQPKILKKTSYQAQDITLDGQPFYDSAQVSTLKSGYQLLGILPVIGIILTVGLLGLMYWLGRDRRKTLIRFAIVLILAGLLTGLTAYSIKPLARRAVAQISDSSISEQALGQKLADAGTELIGTVANTLRPAAAILIVAGAVPLITLQWRAMRRPKPQDDSLASHRTIK